MGLSLFAATGQGDPSDIYIAAPESRRSQTGIPLSSTAEALTGIAVDPTDGTVYAVTGNASAINPRCIVTLDLFTGVTTLVGALGLGGSFTCGDITFDETGQMFGWKAGASSRLVSINKTTGAGTLVGAATAIFGGVLEFVNGTLYVFDQLMDGTDFYTCDPVTGVLTPVATMSGDPLDVANSSSYNPTLGQMHIGDTNGTVIIDLATGVFVQGIDLSTLASGMDAIVWAEDPFNVTPAVRMAGSPLWRFIVTSLTGRTIAVLDQRATDKVVAFALNQPALHSGTVPADDDEINRPFPDDDSDPNLHPNLRLCYGFRYEGPVGTDPYPWICRFGGLFQVAEDQGTDAPVTSYTAYDPWQYLFSRPCLDDGYVLPPERGLLYYNQRGSDIALDLITKTIAAHGTVHLDIDNGELHDTDIVPGPNEMWVIPRGTSVGEALQALCNTGTMDIVMTPVYDPIDRPGIVCELNIYEMAGDTKSSAIMAWDKGRRSITSISRLIDGTQMANKVQMFAGAGGDPVDGVEDATSVAKYGEYWSQQFLSSRLGMEPFVELFGEAQALIRKDGGRSITFDPAPERAPMVLRDYGLGDYLPVWASRNLRQPIEVDYDQVQYDPGAAGMLRVYAIPIEIDDNGVERVRRILTSQDTPA